MTFIVGPYRLRVGSELVSAAIDYVRFVQTLLNDADLQGMRILAPKTVELFHSNPLTIFRASLSWQTGA